MTVFKRRSVLNTDKEMPISLSVQDYSLIWVWFVSFTRAASGFESEGREFEFLRARH